MFRNPLYLLWMFLAAGVAWAFVSMGRSRRRKIANSFGNFSTLKRLLKPETDNRRKLKFLLQGIGLIFLFLALAGPQWGIELSSSKSSSQVVLIAVDSSLSMLTEDISPNRLDKAKNELALILAGLKIQPSPARVGVIAFSGQAALICPLTTDSEAVGQTVGDIYAGMIPTQGTAIGSAIRLAAHTLAHYAGNKNLIILSDGGDHKSHPILAAEEAAANGIRIFTIGLGTPDGGPIPIKDPTGNLTGYQKNKKGGTVIARLREETLSQIATKASGNYWRASASQDEISALLRAIIQGPKAKGGQETAHSYKNHFLIPLFLALIALFIELLIPEQDGAFQESIALGKKLVSTPEIPQEKKSKTPTSAVLALAFCVLVPLVARASGTEADLRTGNKLYTNKQYAPALNAYLSAAQVSPQDPRPIFNAGDALYRLGQYTPAAKAFVKATKQKTPQSLRSMAYYNLGNSAFESSEYAAAAQAYRNSLILNPNNPAGAHNLAVALHYLQHPPPKKKNQKKNPQKKNGGGGTPPPQPRPSSSQRNQQQQSQSPNQLSQDDVHRILSSVTDKNPNVDKRLQQRNPSEAPEGEDW
jgi:Ca-activated chloride channel family protein